MLSSIRKITTSFLAKVLIVIIILPFLFWGMGDVFRGGNQNILATIDSEKISVTNFVNYVGRLNLNEQQRNSLNKTDLLDKILSDYIGKKIIAMEIEDQKINLSNRALKKIIISDTTFAEDNKFSRTKYEKFLLESGTSAPVFEQNIAEQEKKRQLLTFLSEGVFLPEFLIKQEFENENQIKKIQYLDLNKLYEQKIIKEEEIKKIYESNKNFFTQDFKKINYTELLPEDLTGLKEYSKAYFEKIDEIENAILDGSSINDFIEKFSLSLNTIDETNKIKKNKIGQDIKKIENVLFEKIFNLRDVNKTELVSVANKYYLSEVISVNKITRNLEDKEIKEAIISQLKIKNIIESNTKFVKEMSEGKFNKEQFNKLESDNNLEIKKTTLRNVENVEIFNKDIIKEIFKIKDGEFQLITDSLLTKSYLVLSENTEKLQFNKKIKDYKKYKSKAKLSLANEIYSTFDLAINAKYTVEVNQKVLSRVKNTL